MQSYTSLISIFNSNTYNDEVHTMCNDSKQTEYKHAKMKTFHCKMRRVRRFDMCQFDRALTPERFKKIFEERTIIKEVKYLDSGTDS